jgi:murein L,D-transpeptidase YafK
VSAGRNQAGAKTMRALHRNVWLGLALLLVALVAALVLNSDILFDWDHLQIKAERARRHEQATLGVPLSGTPDLAALDRRLAADGLSLGAPVFIRVFKREFELELWMRRDDGFHRFAVYPICRWSGRLGPKLVEGDAQAPEGFYTVDAKALNPTSRWHRSFNLGYPNAYDRSHRRTGSLIMVHGGCGSIGCFAMTNPVVDEIWRLVTAALDKGQARFQVQVFPFRMTEENMARRAHERWLPFWQNLKRGYDLFEQTHVPPRVSVCKASYAFTAAPAQSDGSHQIDNLCLDLTNPKS